MRNAAALLIAAWALPAWAGSVDLPIQVGGAFSVPTTSLKEARNRSTVLQQYDFSCGSAALSTLLTHHYRFTASEQAVFEAMYRQGDQEKIRREGFSMLDMKRFLESHGFQADGFEASLDTLASANVPAIVLINENGYDHFVVIKGLQPGRVLIGDPAGGTRALPQAAFESMWKNGILFVIANRQDQAQFNQATDWAVAPRAPLGGGVNREGLAGVVMPKLGVSDF
ncbi:C39 family peptidase [Aquincola sp. MAHUQ-54]|uniref:C39 family peptidase n=1 Tax=Aquincola agrisoli TaxID=3119538 RepID=A0AAW9QE52_9BURK